MAFYVGQKVVCVRRASSPDHRFHVCEVGATYTIRAIRPDVKRPQYGIGLLFEEITMPLSEATGNEYGFYSYRFRPVVERKTDISIFTEMLTPNTRELVLTNAE